MTTLEGFIYYSNDGLKGFKKIGYKRLEILV